MISSLVVPDYRGHQMLSVFGVLVWTVLLGAFIWIQDRVMVDDLIVGAISWCDLTVWSQLTVNDW